MMTANPTVPADVWACKQPGVPLVAAIVECSCSFDPMMSGRRRRTRLNCPVHGVHGLVALRDARCPTDSDGDGDCAVCARGKPRQPWCVDGRLLHDVRVECEACQGTGDDPPSHVEADYHGPCLACETTDKRHPGHRTVRCLVDVVRVVERPSELSGEPGIVPSATDEHGRWWYFWAPNGSINPTNGGEMRHITPAHVDALAAACGRPPADWPGGYAVILTTTDQEAE